MSRIKDLQKQIHKILAKSMDDNQKRSNAIAHLHGVSLAAVMIAAGMCMPMKRPRMEKHAIMIQVTLGMMEE